MRDVVVPDLGGDSEWNRQGAEFASDFDTVDAAEEMVEEVAEEEEADIEDD